MNRKKQAGRPAKGSAQKKVDWNALEIVHPDGTAERWIGSCRRELPDHVIVLNEEHLCRLIRDYVRYHHEDQIHDSLNTDTPNPRSVERKPSAEASLISLPRLGGLHHRLAWRRAA